DENVFDIQQGVSINLFIKSDTVNQKAKTEVFQTDFFGLRKNKYRNLTNGQLNSTDFKKIQPSHPYYFYTDKDFTGGKLYKKGISVNKLFKVYNTGIETGRDSFFIGFNIKEVASRIKNVYDNLEDDSL